MSVTPPTQNTAGHQTLHRRLSKLGMIGEDEQRVGSYYLDIYVRDFHLGFEFDGPLHTRPKQRAHDRKRDAWLLKDAGIPVFRVTADELRSPDLDEAIQNWVTEQCETLPLRVRKRDQWPVG